ETTASLLNWTWYLLSQHPDVRRRVSDELDRMQRNAAPSMDDLAKYPYLRQVIEESLRLYPPLWLMTRRAIQDDWLDEFFVPAGTEIYISPYLLQHSPHLWELPEKFDPDRMAPDATAGCHELATCPFGAGPRNCIGETFARAESQIHFMIIAKELLLEYENPTPPEMTTGMNLLSKHDFIMQPTLRDSASAQPFARNAGISAS
ncbi:MAG: cytochrome P450, partial [Acetobacteraceae bacterium]